MGKKCFILNPFVNHDSNNNQVDKIKLQKLLEINDFLLSKANVNFLTHDDFNKIRKFAVSEGGFIDNKYRKILWKKIFNIHDGDINCNLRRNFDKIKLLKLDKLSEQVYKYEEVLVNFNTDKNIIDESQLEILKRDVERSAIQGLKCTLHKSFTDFEIGKHKRGLLNFITKLFSLEKFKYDYYQGYHDLILFIFLLFEENERLALLIAQRINEIYLADYLNADKNFVEIIQNNLIRVLKVINIEAYNEILTEDPSESFTSLCLSWVICLFAQKFKNAEKIYRIMDYLFCSNSVAIYHLVANVKITKFFKMSFIFFS
jgi:hypothetical protein